MTNPDAPRTPQPQLGEAMKKLADSLKQKAPQANAEENQDISGGLPKPDKQTIGGSGVSKSSIRWEWNPLPEKEVQVIAVYDREAAVKYGVHLCLEGDDEREVDLAPEECKALGESLISAWQWEEVWQQHAGEYLA